MVENSESDKPANGSTVERGPQCPQPPNVLSVTSGIKNLVSKNSVSYKNLLLYFKLNEN
jgi:hypothetical protein